MTTWPQLYDPFGNRLLSTAVAALPVLTLFFVLVVLKKRVWVSALSGLLVAVALALLVFGMPAVLVATAAGHGFIFGMMRIAWIVVASIFLYNVASTHRAVPGDEGFDCRPVFGQAPAARADCLLLRRVPRRHGRRRRTGGDCRRVPDRAGLQPVSGGDAVSPRQYRAGGVGRRREPHSCSCRRHRIAGSGIQRDGGPHSAADLVDSAALAGADHGRVAGDVAGVAGPAGQRRVVRRHAVLLVELSGTGAGGHRRRHLLTAGDGGLPESLAAGGGHSGRR